MASKSKKRKNTNSDRKRVGRPENKRPTKHVNITMCDDIMKKLDEHENPKEHLDGLLRRECDRILTRIQAKLQVFVNRLAITAAGCTGVLASLYPFIA